MYNHSSKTKQEQFIYIVQSQFQSLTLRVHMQSKFQISTFIILVLSQFQTFTLIVHVQSHFEN